MFGTGRSSFHGKITCKLMAHANSEHMTNAKSSVRIHTYSSEYLKSVWEYHLVLLLTQVKNSYWSMGVHSTSESTIPGVGYSISGICRSANLKVLAVVLVRLFPLFMPHKPESIRVSRHCASCVWKIIFYLTKNSLIKPPALPCKLNVVHIMLKYI